ncbi:Phosphatidylinositol 4-phosphate 3-kinase C2 domain-containing subunit alpha [Fasciola gigantica]|uniref:Phosphatidylinositol 4-phosphate 3-kinase C2 domain-containing subunit alpha n=1 Tax=Fasciola gigantica TaxID=46835 RepID=A0A504YK71_FASGI|nr:Phosphatidylinositol 4-phosphate 3-kinase C2 domain-containing subunit alpha [Fasciola gigantica]
MVMFKAGDDLRLDSLITQITFIMDRIWLNAGLDLRTIHFRIVPTGDRKGLIELVSECSTLRQIQQQGGGLTGPFKDSVITTWIQSQNTTELDYKRSDLCHWSRIASIQSNVYLQESLTGFRVLQQVSLSHHLFSVSNAKALDNFLRSLAGCCVMTYVLGVGDRHNDNIMIRYSGHVFHVDFAKVFGNAQTFAGFKRDRVPFVLTQDMLHVLQAYSREILSEASGASTGFGSSSSSSTGRNSNREGVQLFIDYCCEAYNLIRKHSYSLLSILEMGLTMDIPGVTRESVRYVMRALKLNLSDQQASQHFTELIRKSLQSKLTALNFFVHGLAQVKQASSGGGVSGTGSGSPSIQPNSPRSSMSRADNHENDMLPDTMSSGVAAGTNRAATLNNNTGQLLSFNPKRFSYTQDGHIDAVVVEAAVKKKSNDKHLDHYFPMYVWRKHCRVPTRVYRRIADLNELGLAVQEAYPNSPVLAILPHLLNALNSGGVSSVKTQNNVQTLVDTLLEEDDSVSKMPCELAMSGERGRSNLATPLLTPSVATVGAAVDPRDFGSAAAVQRASESLPALQLELCLSENQQELNLLIKHGRALLIPGSNELPDVYVKVYLLSGRRRKSTKRKTAIIRRSSAPSFNTTFTYELTTHDVQVGFLEISAWHAVNLGENFSLGQVYIQLRSLTPGRSITKWYPLNSDWDAV